MKLPFQISSIIVALLFVFVINFKSVITFNYLLNKAEITELFCINKDKPKLACNGKCHLSTQIAEVENQDEQEPFSQSNSSYHLEINSVLIIAANDLSASVKEFDANNMFIVNENLCKGYLSISSPPPKL